MSFVRYNERTVGRIIASPSRTYRVRSGANEKTLLERLNPAAIPPELPPVQVLRPEPVKVKPGCEVPKRDVVKVLVVYTPQAADYFSHPEDIVRWAVLTVEETRASYQASKAEMDVAVAGIERIEYKETGEMNRDLYRLVERDDEHLDDVHPWRTARQADLVLLLTRDKQASGQAKQFARHHLNNVDFAPHAFAVADIGSSTASYVFTHELGHLMGALHDKEASEGTFGAYDWSYGHLQRNATAPCKPWRSMMAFDATLTPRPVWSNPREDECGDPMGNTDTEDNARTLSDTAPTIASLNCGIE